MSLRKEPPESEKILWSALRGGKLGFVVRRQFPVGPYILDFFVHEAQLAVEVDGECHEMRVVRDERRDAFLGAKGITVLRIPSLELFGNLDHWLEVIYRECARLTGRDPLRLIE